MELTNPVSIIADPYSFITKYM